MYQVKTYNVISPVGLAKLPASQYAVNKSDDPDALIIRSQDMHTTDFGKNVKVIARAGAGFNNIPLDKANEQGTVVFNTPGSNANAVKELVIGMLILCNRHVIDAVNWSAQLVGADVSLQTEKNKNHFAGHELVGKTIGVIGLGNVGSRVAGAAQQLGMKVVGYDPYISVEHALQLSNQIPRLDSLAELLQQSDFVTVHIPYTEDNRHLIGENEIAMMPEGAVLFNYSRTDIVDDVATTQALDNGHLQLYVTDFSTKEAVENPKAIVTPHLGGTTEEAEINGAVMAANTIMDFLEQGIIHHSVNMPEMTTPMQYNYRITVMHQNVPNMLGQITTAVANADINIDNLSNQSRDTMAYTVIDVNKLDDDTEALVKNLETIPAVVRVRLLHK